jgi:hypothetical protein
MRVVFDGREQPKQFEISGGLMPENSAVDLRFSDGVSAVDIILTPAQFEALREAIATVPKLAVKAKPRKGWFRRR